MGIKRAARPSKETILQEFRKVMATRNRIHVFPWEGTWSVKRAGTSRASRVVKSKAEAIEIARAQARRAAMEVIVHDRNGDVVTRETPSAIEA